MSQHKPLRIVIPRPCQENWEDMSPEGKGRFCAACKKTIVDLSTLSDGELYKYFSANPQTCGRFHKSQLSREIIPLNKHTSFWHRMLKQAAILLALFFADNRDSGATIKDHSTAIYPLIPKPSTHPDDKIMISGVVKDEYNTVLEGVEIIFGDKPVTKTDKEGRFEFEIVSTGDLKPTLLMFNYPGMVTARRNYHPAMLSTSYNVTLYPPNEGSQFTMGIIEPDTLKSLPAIITIGRSELTDSTKTLMATIAIELRSHPESRIDIVAFTGEKNYRSRSVDFQKALRTYFVEKEGIDPERIMTTIEKGDARKQRVIELRNYLQQ